MLYTLLQIAQLFSPFFLTTGTEVIFLKKMLRHLLLLKESVGHAPLLEYALLDNCIGRLYTKIQVSATLSKKVLIVFQNFKNVYSTYFRMDLQESNK